MRRIRHWRPRSGHIFTFFTFITFLTLISTIIAGYYYDWAWTGVSDYIRPKNDREEFQRGKTLWDWMQLLIIPAALAGGAVWFNRQEKATERELATDKQREDALQTYLDTMSNLLLNHGLRNSSEDDEVQQVARSRTLSVLRRLNPERKGAVLQFLHEANLINKDNTIIKMQGADLRGADLRQATLQSVDLRGVDLSEADLQSAYLQFADLQEANLINADLTRTLFFGATLKRTNFKQAKMQAVTFMEADLQGAYLQQSDVRWGDFRYANLSRAFLDFADLREADLRGAILCQAVLVGTKLQAAKLEGANVEGVSYDYKQVFSASSPTDTTSPRDTTAG